MIDQSEIHEKAVSPTIEDRREAVRFLKSGFSQFLDKLLAWQDLRGLTQDEDSSVRMGAAFALESAFCHITDKSEAWRNIVRLIQDENSFVSWAAGKAAGISFRHVPDRNNAWQDLHKLTLSEDWYVRDNAGFALGLAYQHIPDREQGWQDLHRLINDEYIRVRERAAIALGIAFKEIPNKSLAWEDLHRLARDEDRRLRIRAADSLGLAFSEIPDRSLALQDLFELTQDIDWDVRKYTYHSLGRAHIITAIDSKNIESWRKAFKHALRYFEKSYKYSDGHNPSDFCLPFYCFCFGITSGDITGDKIQKYIMAIKNAFVSCGREEFSIEIGGLARTLQDYFGFKVISSEDLTSELNTFLQYHDKVIEYVDPMEWCIVDAARLMLKYNSLSQNNIELISKSIDSINQEDPQLKAFERSLNYIISILEGIDINVSQNQAVEEAKSALENPKLSWKLKLEASQPMISFLGLPSIKGGGEIAVTGDVNLQMAKDNLAKAWDNLVRRIPKR